MPVNEVAERIHNFTEQDSFSQILQSQVQGQSWPVLNNNPWVGTQRQNGVLHNFDSKNYTSYSSGINLYLCSELAPLLPGLGTLVSPKDC